MLFYQLSTDAFVSSLPMESLLRGIINAPLAVKVWGGWYELNAQLGLEKKPWIGLQLNVLAVLLCFVLLGRSISAIDCFHNRAVSWGQTLFVASGITFLYASEHIRDGFVFLFVSCLFFVFLLLLTRPRVGLFFIFVLVFAAFLMLMPLLRVKITLLPLIFLALYFFSMIDRLSVRNTLLLLGSLVLFFAFIASYLDRFETITTIIERNSSNYGQLALTQSGSGSLGYQLVVDQPSAIRAVVGFFYLHFQPIPFWAGVDSRSTYHWFKSLYSLFNHITLPFALLTCFLYLRSLIRKRYEVVTRAVRFAVLVYLAGFVGVAMSSVETRHSGLFLIPYIIVVCFGVANAHQLRRWRKLYFQLYGLGLVLIYLAWFVLKFG